jgi:hypothetical protein
MLCRSSMMVFAKTTQPGRCCILCHKWVTALLASVWKRDYRQNGLYRDDRPRPYGSDERHARAAEVRCEQLGSDARSARPRYGLSHDQDVWARFVNNHAWALVRLQSAGKIRKLATGVYALTEAPPTPPQAQPTEPIRDGEPLPEWARQQVRCANSRNNARDWNEVPPLFSEECIRQLWRKCRGRCAMTGLPFDDKEVGTGQARRPFAPSLDRVDPDKPYTVENCRLVLQGQLCAQYTFGDHTFFRIATAAAKGERPDSGAHSARNPR